MVDNETLTAENGKLTEKFKAEKRLYDSLNSKYNDLSDRYETLADDMFEMTDEFYFFHEYAVIVMEGASDYYHSYDCPDLDHSSNFWIYNTEYAKYLNIKPCPKCQGD